MYLSKNFDKFRFFQALMKNTNYEDILNRIPEEKKIDYFARNYKVSSFSNNVFRYNFYKIKGIFEVI